MYRQYVNFYINRNNLLCCVWFARRKGHYVSHDPYKPWDQQFEPLGLADEQYAVRCVPLGYNCDKSNICKVAYTETIDSAIRIIQRKVQRSTAVTMNNLCYRHFVQLVDAPRKYAEWFFEWLSNKVTQRQYEKIWSEYCKAASQRL